MNYAAYLFQLRKHEDGDICNEKTKNTSLTKTSKSLTSELVENLAAAITSIQNNNKTLDDHSRKNGPPISPERGVREFKRVKGVVSKLVQSQFISFEKTLQTSEEKTDSFLETQHHLQAENCVLRLVCSQYSTVGATACTSCAAGRYRSSAQVGASCPPLRGGKVQPNERGLDLRQLPRRLVRSFQSSHRLHQMRCWSEVPTLFCRGFADSNARPQPFAYFFFCPFPPRILLGIDWGGFRNCLLGLRCRD